MPHFRLFRAFLRLLPLLFVFTGKTASAQWLEDPALDSTVERGIRAVYNLDFETADRAFQMVVQTRRDHPSGHFFLAMVDWWRILIEPERRERDAAFVRKLDRVVAMCDARLERDERDLAGLFFKGGAIGFRGRLRAMRKEWIDAAGDGKQALPVVRDAARLAPDNADLNLGTGIYNYYADVLPDRHAVLKPLMLFLPSGDRVRGLAQLRAAAEKARYARWEAMYFLAQVYATYENKPSVALGYIRTLCTEFPANAVFHRTLGRTYVRLGNWKDAAAVFEDIAVRSERGMPGYGISAAREAQYYIGFDAMERGDFSMAIKAFVRCDELSREIDRDGPSGFMVLANLKMGMVHDLLGQRAFALKQYEKVLGMPDHSNAHRDARRFKRTPAAR